MFDQNLTIYTVFYKESESEVKKCKILEPGGKNLEKTNVKSLFFIFPRLCYLNREFPISLFLGDMLGPGREVNIFELARKNITSYFLSFS